MDPHLEGVVNTWMRNMDCCRIGKIKPNVVIEVSPTM